MITHKVSRIISKSHIKPALLVQKHFFSDVLRMYHRLNHVRKGFSSEAAAELAV